ncbi:hypothetical protein WJX72_000127 [[Myrmecia] bisecta]|uniref:Cation/H+ exchanger transmembrane domain-containing protein n=1 Tax=[Myrmecia] bisecta TaxID=41462 RepID=A0AAW1Q0T1_9CHLO
MASDAASSGAAAVTFVAAVAMLLGVMVLKLQRWLPLPYTALLLIWGIALGVGNVTFTGGWRVYGAGVTSWQNVAPAFILSVLLPGILFAGTFAMPKAVLQRSFAHIFLLGVVGVLMGTCLTAVFARYAFPFHWTWPQCLLFSSVLAATDPVAIVAVLKERQVPDELTVVVDGEALVDDGVAAVLYNVCRSLVRGGGMNAAAVVRLLCRQSLGGPAIGLAFGLCLTAALLLTPLELLPQLGLTLVAAFGSFIVAEAMLHTNGILAVVACGFLVAMLSRPVDGTGKQLHLTWTSIEWVLNTLLFILIGIIVAGRTYEAHHVMGAVRITASDYGWAVLLWVALLAIRAVDVLLLWPLLAAAGHGFMLQDALVTVWSGLRGVVGKPHHPAPPGVADG